MYEFVDWMEQRAPVNMTAMASKISFSKTKKKNKKKKKKRRNKHNQGKNVIYMLIILHNELVI